MKAEDILDGQVYWTCKPSQESISYGQEDPVDPHQAKAKWEQRPGGLVLLLHCFDAQTGNIDTDSNATVLLTDRHLDECFTTREGAAQHFRRQCEARIEEYEAAIAALSARIIHSFTPREQS